MKISKVLLPLFIAQLIAGCQSAAVIDGELVKYDSLCTVNNDEGKRVANNESFNPIVRVEPRYPKQAVRNRLSGYVKIEFDIDSKGQPINLHVIESYPDKVFIDSSLNALSKWRYKTFNNKCQLVQLDYSMG